MKKRTINYILLTFLFVIWFFVFKKAFNFFDEPTDFIENPNEIIITNNSINYSKDTFQLETLKRDPFLGSTSNKSKTISAIITTSKAPTKTKPKTQILKNQWPSIKYYGYVQGNTNKDKLILIKINNRLHRLRIKDEIENVSIQQAYGDSIYVKFENEFKMVKK